MAKATLHLWHSLTQYCKKGTALIKNTTLQKWQQHKWHLTQMACHKTGISKLNITDFLKYYQHSTNRTFPYN